MLLLPLLLIASACGGSGKGSARDLSTEGRLSYACALVRDAIDEHGPVHSWSEGFGPDTDPGVRRIAAATALIGSPIGVDHRHGALSEASRTVFQGLGRADIEVLGDAVEMLRDACEDQDLPEGDPDVSDDERVEYACALVHDIRENDGPVDSWAAAIGDDADDAFVAASGALGLLDGFVGDRESHGALSEAATTGVSAIAALRNELLQESLDAIEAACAD